MGAAFGGSLAIFFFGSAFILIGSAFLFGLLFGASIALHFWIGGVVVETKHEAGQNYLLLREDRTNWVPVSPATYWAHVITKYTIFAACLSAAVWVAWQWLWRGSLKN